MTKKNLKLPVLDISGKTIKEMVLPEKIFSAKLNLPLMAQAVRIYLLNQRKAFAKVKTRGEVRGSGRKIWRQKGTGQARHGDRYAPIFVGGGRAHGPKGNQAYRLKMSKKMKRAALFSALTAKLNDKRILIVEGLKDIQPKTKNSREILIQIFGKEFDETKKHLLVLPERWPKTIMGFRNLSSINFSLASNLNTYQVLNNEWLILVPDSIKKIAERVKEKKNG